MEFKHSSLCFKEFPIFFFLFILSKKDCHRACKVETKQQQIQETWSKKHNHTNCKLCLMKKRKKRNNNTRTTDRFAMKIMKAKLTIKCCSAIFDWEFIAENGVSNRPSIFELDESGLFKLLNKKPSCFYLSLSKSSIISRQFPF